MSVVEAPATVRVDEVASVDALRALAPEWAALWARSPGATPFQHPAWLVPWWECFGEQPGWRLWTLAIRAGDRLVAVAPLFIHPGPDPRFRQLSPVGVGNSDYLGPIVDPADGGGAIAAILEHLLAHAERWDLCDLEELRAGDPLLAAPMPGGLGAEASPQSTCPVLALPDDAEAFFAARSAWLRRNLRRGTRRLEERGELSFHTADADTLPEFVDAFFRLHEQRWRAQGRDGLLRGEAMRRFHRASSARLMAAGLLRLHGVRLDGRLVAIFHGLDGHGRVHAYLGGYEPELGRDSPGTLIAAHAIEQAIAEGASELDFLRGQEKYKYDWGAVDRRTHRLRIRHARSPERPW
ncbi:MAG TPA: GNAT family N-acetyltransferase [Longimicrobium sp.]|nr:GNAT family N-acetyltransferase [Longimicrobium sp.]